MDRAHKSAQKLQENYDQWGWLGGYEDVIDRIRQPGKELYAPMSTINDRRNGHNWPFWRTWAEHARLRASARLLCQLSPIASGALTGFRAYVLGNGFTYRPLSERGAPAALLGAVQDVIDEFCVDNDWCQIEKEGFDRSRRDGELFILHEENDRRLMVEIIEPEQVQAPPGEGEGEEWTYGVRTSGRQTHRPLEYHVVEDPGFDGDYYDPSELHHLKVNVDVKVKRGLTDFCYDTHDSIRTAGRLIDHVGQGAAIQASIALIRQHQTASPSQVQDFAQAASDYDRYDPISGRQEYSEGYRPGKILDIDAGQEYVVPPFSSNVGGYIEVVQGILRSVAVRWNAPEWLISADASGTNYASSVTAESPFVKRCYQEQEAYKAFFLRSIWAAVRCAAKNGRIRALGRKWSWEEVRQVVDIQVEAPRVETRDTSRESQTNQTYVSMGAKSIQTVQQELGLDAERELANMLAWKAAGTAPQQSGGGEGGGDPDDPTATLRGSVGGSQALMAIQTAYYAGTMPREACIANARIVYGFTQEDAEALFPEVQPTKLNPEQVGEPEGQGGPGGPGGGMGDATGMMGGGGESGEESPEQGDELADEDDANPLDDLLGLGDDSEAGVGAAVPSLEEAERKDKRGRRMCFDDTTGKRIPCAPKEKEKKERKKADPDAPNAPKKKRARKAEDITDEEVMDVLIALSEMNTADEMAEHLAKQPHALVKVMAKNAGEKANGGTVAIARRLADRIAAQSRELDAEASGEEQPEGSSGDESGGEDVTPEPSPESSPEPAAEQQASPSDRYKELTSMPLEDAEAAIDAMSDEEAIDMAMEAQGVEPGERDMLRRIYGDQYEGYAKDTAKNVLRWEAKKKAARQRVEKEYSELREQVQADSQSAGAVRSLAEMGDGDEEASRMVNDHLQKMSSAQQAYLQHQQKGTAESRAAALKAWTDLSAQLPDVKAAAEKLRQETRQKALAALAAPSPSSIPIKRSRTVSDETWQRVEEAQEWLQTVCGDTGAGAVRVAEGPEGTRANYKEKGASGQGEPTVLLDATSDTGTIVHEMCHHLERQPGVREALDKFLEGRCSGEEPKKLNDVTSGGFDDDEMGRQDDFAKTFGERSAWYVGKAYGGDGQGKNQASELLSMCVQKLYEDPAGFAKSDPELCQFIIGVLHGRIRG